MTDEDAMSTVKQVSENVREVARNVRESLEEGRQRGASSQIVRDVVREAPLASLAVAFLIGYVIARR